jgi:NAD(P)-dependent dehydrogenase (short-subunit alcohol dehydrogenase family)
VNRVALVTGAARGIGLELCRQLLAAGDTVIGCPRRGCAAELDELAGAHADSLHVVPLDVADRESIAAAAREVARRVDRIDLLFNNAGIYPKSDGGLEQFDPQNLVRSFEVNALGPLLVVRELLPLLRRGSDKRLVQLTSRMGSIADNTSGGSWAYRMSKTALNMAVRNLAHELGAEGFVCLAIHPGWVQTRMGGAGAPIGLSEATAEVLRLALAAGPLDNGAFKGPGGKDLPY